GDHEHSGGLRPDGVAAGCRRAGGLLASHGGAVCGRAGAARGPGAGAVGYAGSERTTRRAVADLKAAWAAGRRRVHRPWIAEPGMWAQYDFGDGPRIGETATVLFCVWLAWS